MVGSSCKKSARSTPSWALSMGCFSWEEVFGFWLDSVELFLSILTGTQHYLSFDAMFALTKVRFCSFFKDNRVLETVEVVSPLRNCVLKTEIALQALHRP